jgi:hypothetical protein
LSISTKKTVTGANAAKKEAEQQQQKELKQKE